MPDALQLAKQQMRANFEAVLKHYSLPIPKYLIALSDRAYWMADIPFLAALQYSKDFDPWPIHGNHGVETAASWRENVNGMSMQIVQHGKPPGEVMIETDFDGTNPDCGLAYAIKHFIVDVILRRKPTPWQIAERLRKRGIGVQETMEGV